MVDEETKKYPTMSPANWFALRKRFRSTIPSQVTKSYLASALHMTADSARANVLPTLRGTGLIDDDGKPQELAIKWRDDSQYQKVCEDIRSKVYPQELLDLAPPEEADRGTVTNWFANHTGGGESVVRKMTSFYLMLCEANPNMESETPTPTSTKTRSASKRPAPSKKGQSPNEPLVQSAVQSNASVENGETSAQGARPKQTRLSPEFHFNIQVVLPENASPENYDAIFRSIATHLLGRTEE